MIAPCPTGSPSSADPTRIAGRFTIALGGMYHDGPQNAKTH